jgi:hypothetical protein
VVVTLIDEHRAFLMETRALATDDQGREVLAGLTFEETDQYLRGLDKSGASDLWLELDDRHQQARLQMISAENEARFAGPKH